MIRITRVGMSIGCAVIMATPAIALTQSQSPASSPSQLATIPVAVAEAMQFDIGGMFARPQYFDGTLPTGWPATLIPATAAIVGGGLQGVRGVFSMKAAVFSFASFAVGNETIRSMLARTGYTQRDLNSADGQGGFASTPRDGNRAATFCSDSVLVMFGSMERTQGANIFSMTVIDGSAGRQNCSPQTAPGVGRSAIPITLPTLEPPKGTVFASGGSNWSGDGGNTNGIILTTLQADSILYHYRDQLVAGGWRAEGKAGIGDGVAVQRFTFREKDEPWSASLLITVSGDRRDVQLRYSRAP